jgi:hypothetical protein
MIITVSFLSLTLSVENTKGPSETSMSSHKFLTHVPIRMSSSNSFAPALTSLDLYYLAVSANIFKFGYLIIMSIGFIGNICQIITFSRRTMRRISTGVLFLALSISDTTFLCLNIYPMLIYGFGVIDRSDINVACRARHFLNNFVTNFSAWMLVTSECRAIDSREIDCELFSFVGSMDSHAISFEIATNLYATHGHLHHLHVCHRRCGTQLPFVNASVRCGDDEWRRSVWTESSVFTVRLLFCYILAVHQCVYDQHYSGFSHDHFRLGNVDSSSDDSQSCSTHCTRQCESQ